MATSKDGATEERKARHTHVDEGRLFLWVLLVGIVAVTTLGITMGGNYNPISTYTRDGHWWVVADRSGIAHHPDCPCRSALGRTAPDHSARRSEP